MASVRNPERWKDPQQREKALAEQKEMEELRKQQEEKEAQEEKKRQTAEFWRKLELCAESEDIARQIGASGFMTKLLYENGLVADVARVLGIDLQSHLSSQAGVKLGEIHRHRLLQLSACIGALQLHGPKPSTVPAHE